jgi:hypothetical protein
MFYISYHGGSDGINNIESYDKSGKLQGDVLEVSASAPLSELRAFAFVNGQLFVVNGYKKYSQLLVYAPGKNGVYTFSSVYASPVVNSIFHPYDFTFDGAGNCYISNQDTNVVAWLKAANEPNAVAPWLSSTYGANFLEGSFVASSDGSLPGTKAVVNVPLPQGLAVSFSDGKVAHSVRGVLWYDGFLYVADEPGNTVKVYDAKGQLNGQLMSADVQGPVQLLVHGHHLYIGSSGNDFVLRYNLQHGAPTGVVAPEVFISSDAKSISGMCFDADDNFYVADRKGKKIKQFDKHGKYTGDFLKDLKDNPEFIVYNE